MAYRYLVFFILGVPLAAAVLASADDKPDLEIRGRFSAREMRVYSSPRVFVTFTGSSCRKTVWKGTRKNFPKPLTEGVYRDVEGEVEISSTFRDCPCDEGRECLPPDAPK